jgi:hypothetical protein
MSGMPSWMGVLRAARMVSSFWAAAAMVASIAATSPSQPCSFASASRSTRLAAAPGPGHLAGTMAGQLSDLKQAHATLRQGRDKWQASTHTLLRAIQVLRLENSARQAEARVLEKSSTTLAPGETAASI